MNKLTFEKSIELLFKRSLNPNITDENGVSLLHLAILYGIMYVVIRLIEGGASIEKRDQNGKTALHKAVIAGKWQIVILLLKRGADPCVIDHHRNTPGHYAHRYRKNCKKKCSKKFKKTFKMLKNATRQWILNLAVKADAQSIAKMCKSKTHCYEFEGMTMLLLAVKYGHSNIVRHLILNCVVDIDAVDHVFNMTPLMWAAFHRQTECVQILLELGVDADGESDFRLVSGTTALMIAAENGNPSIIVSLLECSNIEKNDYWGMTALMRALDRTCVKGVKTLVENGANVNAIDINGKSALSYAVDSHNVRNVNKLLHHSTHVNYRDRLTGFTPLMMACGQGFVKVVKQLLDYGGDITAKIDCECYFKDNTHLTALILACRYGHRDVVKTLIKHLNENPLMFNAPRISIVLNALDGNLMTGLMHACSNGDTLIVELLLDQGALITQRSIQGKTALMLAVRKGNVAAAKLLIAKGADISTNDNYGRGLLSSAVGGYINTWGMIWLMIQHCRGSIDELDNNGLNALMYASLNGDWRIIKLLHDQGNANINAVSRRRGITALMLAVLHDRIDVVHALLQCGAYITVQNLKGYTALTQYGFFVHPISKNIPPGRREIIQVFKHKGVNIDRDTSMHHFVRKGLVGDIMCLLHSDASVLEKNKDGISPLISAMLINPVLGLMLAFVELKSKHVLRLPDDVDSMDVEFLNKIKSDLAEKLIKMGKELMCIKGLFTSDFDKKLYSLANTDILALILQKEVYSCIRVRRTLREYLYPRSYWRLVESTPKCEFKLELVLEMIKRDSLKDFLKFITDIPAHAAST